MRHCLLAVVIVCVVAPAITVAQDKVYVKNREKFVPGKTKIDYIAGKIAKESPQGIDVTGVKLTIPADEIVDIEYELNPVDVRLNIYRPAFNADLKAHDPKAEAQRKTNLAAALKGYEDTLNKLAADQEFAKRNVEYRIGYLLAQQARDNPAAATVAIKKLSAFKGTGRGGWQIVRAMHLLANLQLEQNQFDDAEKTFDELAGIRTVAEPIRQDAMLSAAKVSIRAKKYPQALEKLDRMMKDAGLPKDHPFMIRARVARAECLMAAKPTQDKGRGALREIIKDTTDKGVKAAAYNTLGVSHFNAGEFKEARWEFLWVDVVYNQDRAEHAKALYYLWRTFKELGEGERAQECLDALLSDRQFVGSEFQVQAQRESKS